MKIWFLQNGVRQASDAFLKKQSLHVQARLNALIDEIKKTGTLKSRINVDANGKNEWAIRVTDERNVLLSMVMTVENFSGEAKKIESDLFKNRPAKTRRLEVRRSPSEIETRYEDRTPYTVDTWTVDEYAKRLPAQFRARFNSVVADLLAGAKPSNVKAISEDEIEIALDHLRIRAVWKVSSLPIVP